MASVGGITSEGATFFHKLFDGIWLVGRVVGKAGQKGWGEEEGEARKSIFLQVLADIWLVGWEMVVCGRTQESVHL